jgi:hypothetical protein
LGWLESVVPSSGESIANGECAQAETESRRPTKKMTILSI